VAGQKRTAFCERLFWRLQGDGVSLPKCYLEIENLIATLDVSFYRSLGYWFSMMYLSIQLKKYNPPPPAQIFRFQKSVQ